MWLNVMFVSKLEMYLSPNVARRLQPPGGYRCNNHRDEE
ncbi:hypothetical protein CGRA01v4_14747 [Colletotrichum graminicola]|nr:hypothetical protein CGRA01v4_14747 [Colletotrichum graminicola]